MPPFAPGANPQDMILQLLQQFTSAPGQGAPHQQGPQLSDFMPSPEEEGDITGPYAKGNRLQTVLAALGQGLSAAGGQRRAFSEQLARRRERELAGTRRSGRERFSVEEGRFRDEQRNRREDERFERGRAAAIEDRKADQDFRLKLFGMDEAKKDQDFLDKQSEDAAVLGMDISGYDLSNSEGRSVFFRDKGERRREMMLQKDPRRIDDELKEQRDAEMEFIAFVDGDASTGSPSLEQEFENVTDEQARTKTKRLVAKFRRVMRVFFQRNPDGIDEMVSRYKDEINNVVLEKFGTGRTPTTRRKQEPPDESPFNRERNMRQRRERTAKIEEQFGTANVFKF